LDIASPPVSDAGTGEVGLVGEEEAALMVTTKEHQRKNLPNF
jgi:hypothetical protein